MARSNRSSDHEKDASQSATGDMESQPVNAEQMEVMIRTLLTDYSSRVDGLTQQQGLKISENAREISELSDLVTGLSVKMTQWPTN